MINLKRMDVSRPNGLILVTVACVLLSAFFFSPRLWLMRDYVPGSFQWDRGHTYLQQCEQPFRRDIETAMHWRVLPPLVAHTLGLSGKTPFLLPWLGVIVLVGYIAVLHARRLPDAQFVLGGTLLAATTSAVLVPVGWLGINDAWIWCGLLAVAFGRSCWALPLACVLCPWIDERFVIGFSLAWTVRSIDRDMPFFSRHLLVSVGWFLPYIITRLAFGGNPLTNTDSNQFLTTQLSTALILGPMAPIGWWMGLRVGWISVGYVAVNLKVYQRWLIGTVLAGTVLLSLFLASDISRSVAILLPVILLGGFSLARRHPARAPLILLGAGCANLVIPAAHVILTHIDPINPFPVEIIRWLRLQ